MHSKRGFIVLMLLLGAVLSLVGHAIAQLNIDDLNALQRETRDAAKEMKLPENTFSREMQEKASGMADFVHSEAFQNKLQAEQERLKNTLFGNVLSEHGERLPVPDTIFEANERIYVFVSASIPKPTLRNYAADIAKLSEGHVAMVMRGFIGGMKHATPTFQFVAELIAKKSTCEVFKDTCDAHRVNFMVDPLLFRRYGIERVPAIVYVNGLLLNDPAMSEGLQENAATQIHHVVYGEISLQYALEKIQRAEGVNRASITSAINTLKGKTKP